MGGRACARGAYRHYLVLNQVEGSLDIHPLFAVQGVGVLLFRSSKLPTSSSTNLEVRHRGCACQCQC